MTTSESDTSTSLPDIPEINLTVELAQAENSQENQPLCYAVMNNLCKYTASECSRIHGDMCRFCNKPALHPYNNVVRRKHLDYCKIRKAIEESANKVCSICFEVVMDKRPDQRSFGLLPNCNHCFCLCCIRRWRRSTQFQYNVIKACPECRVQSDFVCPSTYWAETESDKKRTIAKYKSVLAYKDCKYFKKGNGSCPFGNKCFYAHRLPNGEKVDVGPPRTDHRYTEEELATIARRVEVIRDLLSRYGLILPFEIDNATLDAHPISARTNSRNETLN